jgi:hypothetical protein
MITRSTSNKNNHNKCSICRNSDHDIRNCTDIKIQKIIKEKEQLYSIVYKQPDNYNKIREWLSNKSTIELSILAVKLNIPTTYPKYIKIDSIFHEMKNELISIQLDYILCKVYETPVNNIKYITNYENRKNICGKVIDLMRRQKLCEPVFVIIQVLNKIDLNQNPREYMNYLMQNIMFTSLENKQYFYACYYISEYMIDVFLPKQRKWNININEIKNENVDIINECPICIEEYSNKNKVYTNCHHSFCSECIKKHLHTFLDKPVPTCPICRTDIKELSTYSIELLS